MSETHIQVETLTLLDGRKVDVIRDVEKVRNALIELTQWREVAGKMATAIALYGNSKLVESLNAYDALAKLSDGGKG